MIVLEHLRKEYRNSVPLKDVNATINDGDVVCVIGPSGSGKSTLIRCINMLDRPTSGKITVNGIEVTSPDCDICKVRKRIGMVFQDFNLFDHMTVLENVIFAPVELLNMTGQEAYDRAVTLLHTVGMESRMLHYPDMLTSGQKQRVAIARALSMDPDIVLFDEPTSALDPTMVSEVQAVIRSLASSGKTMIIITHDLKFAREICNRVFYMDQGEIYEEGTPEQLFDDPQKELTRQFIRQLKVFETLIDRHDYDYIGFLSKMEQFGYKNGIPAKTIYRVQSLFEELCHEILLPELEEKKVLFSVEYDSQNGQVTAFAKYPGKQFDPLESDNALSVKIIRNITESVICCFSEEDSYSNTVRILLK